MEACPISRGFVSFLTNEVWYFSERFSLDFFISDNMPKGEIVLGCLAPHPPHVVYAENPEQNEPVSEGGWETLRWGYNRLARKLKSIDYDALVIFTPHWQTYIGTHFLGLPEFKSKSVDPVFPNIFRYNYDIKVDVDLAERMREKASEHGIITKMMRNQDFRVDYGTITSCHMLNPDWDKPIVTISSNSLSHRHFVTESPLPEDMSKEHIYNHSQYVWDMKLVDLMREGKMRELIDILPEFTEQTIAETEAGGLTWMMAAMGFPEYSAEIYGYQSVIGTGNLVAAWDPNSVTREIVL